MKKLFVCIAFLAISCGVETIDLSDYKVCEDTIEQGHWYGVFLKTGEIANGPDCYELAEGNFDFGLDYENQFYCLPHCQSCYTNLLDEGPSCVRTLSFSCSKYNERTEVFCTTKGYTQETVQAVCNISLYVDDEKAFTCEYFADIVKQ